MDVKNTTILPIVKNVITNDIICSIPESIVERRDFLKRFLKHLDGEVVYCPALGVNVSIVFKSIVETSENAAVTKESTIAALNVVELIKNSIYDGMDIPVSKTTVLFTHDFCRFRYSNCHFERK